MLKKLYKVFFYLFFAFLPLRIGMLLFGLEIYDSGFFNPYFSHYLYLSDVVLLIGFVLFGLSLLFSNKPASFEKITIGDKKIFIFLFLVFISYLISFLFSSDIVNSFFYTLRFVEFFSVYLLVVNGVIDFKKALLVFCVAMFFEALIGISQYIFQRSVGFRFLGEPIMNAGTLGIAKLDFMNMKFLRSYGTFSHPNVFAGYLVFTIFSMIYMFKNAPRIFGVAIVVCSVALILTFSRTGIIAFVGGLFVFSFFNVSHIRMWQILKKIIVICFVVFIFLLVFRLFPILLNRFGFFDSQSIQYRIMYLLIGFSMFLYNPFGVGIGNFTNVMQSFSVLKLAPWDIQPVHNIFVIMLSETGFFGFVVFISLFVYLFVYSIKNKTPFFVSIVFLLFVVGFFDHYLVTLYQGQALFWLSICALYPFKNSLADIGFLPSI